MLDSLIVAGSVAPCICEHQPVVIKSGTMDTVLAIAMAIIAIADIILTIFIFRQARKDSSEVERKHRKFELMQSLILNHRLYLLYNFYDAVSKECEVLRTNADKETKKMVDDNNKALLKKFRLDFLILFNVIDHNLYNDMKTNADNLIDGITESIFDEGINLTHGPKFDELITEPLSRNRNKIVALLYELANMDS